jgi:hypothetical protein
VLKNITDPLLRCVGIDAGGIVGVFEAGHPDAAGLTLTGEYFFATSGTRQNGDDEGDEGETIHHARIVQKCSGKCKNSGRNV